MTEPRFATTVTPLAGLTAVTRKVLGDDRGFLSRLFCADELAAIGFDRPVVQINHTLSRRAGTIRGMHFQHSPHAEDKYVSCLRGEVWDVAVDLRRNSPTFLQWHGELLSAGNARSLFIPQGFAHGFQTLTEDCELLYLHTAAYNPAVEEGVSPLDRRLAIAWPLPPTEMSDRDRSHPPLADHFTGVALSS